MQQLPIVVPSVCVTAVSVIVALRFAQPRRPLPYALAKGTASLGFVATALAAGALSADWTRLALVALVLAAVGDVVLAVPGPRAFLGGLLAFAAAHAVFSAAFLLHASPRRTVALVAVPVALVVGGVWLWLRRRVPHKLRIPVAVYLAAASLMLASGIAAGATRGVPLLAAGVLLTVGSDIGVARQQFVHRAFANQLVGLPAYYLGQLLIALSLA